MHLSQLSIEGYKGVGEKTIVPLHKGLNVIVGENASGKTTIIDAIRLLLREDEFGYSPVLEGDFYKAFTEKSEPADYFLIQGKFGALSDDDKVAFLPWYDLSEHADLSIKVENKEKYGRFKRQVWGGSSKSSAFEWELFDKINCIYLPPLRDAETKLKEGKSSRLARLLKNLESSAIKDAKEKKTLHTLEKKMKSFNAELSKDKSVQGMNDKIRQKLNEAAGKTFGQDTHISFSEVGFNRIAESLRLFFFPDVGGHDEKGNYRSLDENSLGHNNLLYIATVLAELINSGEEDERFKVLLVEEPEAHLHPQLQIRLLKYLEEIAESDDVQVIVTSHSPVLASSASIENLIHISAGQQGSINTVSLKETGIYLTVTKDKEGKDLAIPPSDKFLSRWLDTTKSTLLFAKGIILVEGIAEAFLVPTMATKILRSYNEGMADKDKLSSSLDKAGVSVINMNGIYFMHFMRLFCNFGNEDSVSSNIAIKCAGITDRDPEKEIDEKTKKKTIPARPIKPNHGDGKNPALKLEAVINSSDCCRLYVGAYKTLEYDLAMEENNIQVMAKILTDNWHNKGDVYKELEILSKKDWLKESPENKGDAANQLLKRIEDSNMGKGYFAQLLSENIVENDNFIIPEYIESAVVWACGGAVVEQ